MILVDKPPGKGRFNLDFMSKLILLCLNATEKNGESIMFET